MITRPRVSLVLGAILCLLAGNAASQSASATVLGTVRDAQGHPIAGASIALRHKDTGALRVAGSDDAGRFRVLGLPPGTYVVVFTASGFADEQREISLTLAGERRLDTELQLARLRESVSVSAPLPGLETSKTMIGRIVAPEEIERLPVAGRDFATLALLAPGVLPNLSGNLASSTGIVAAGQTGRSNTFLLDGLSVDDTYLANLRCSVPLDAIREFAVSTSGLPAEYGQASGAVVTSATRSGTNRWSSRTYYYHRDSRWDAMPVAARLTGQQDSGPSFEQKVPGMTLGGPLRQNRAFLFVSGEGTLIDSAYLVASPLFPVLRPGAARVLPVTARARQSLARGDLRVGSAGRVTLEYLGDGESDRGRAGSGNDAPETQADGASRDDDFVVGFTSPLGTRTFNELHAAFSHTSFQFDRGSYCSPPCPGFSEVRPGITLGTFRGAQTRARQWNYQVRDVFSTVRAGRSGEHTLSVGGDVWAVVARLRGAPNQLGTFTFDNDAPFDTAVPATYPGRYSRTIGDPDVGVDHTLIAIFGQDHWTPTARVTIDAGVRWDYDTLTGFSRDTDNVAPRLAIAFNAGSRARTTLRSTLGVHYDQALFQIVRQVRQSEATHVVLLRDPGYPDPDGPNPKRVGTEILAPNTRVLEPLQMPSALQTSVGLEHVFGPDVVVSVDAVWAHGHHLFVTRDLNAGDASGTRPNPGYQLIQAVEARGRSWYRGLQLGLVKRNVARYSYSLAYTLSNAERDTEEYDFTPQDQHDFAGERGPSTSDVRHQLVLSGSAILPFGLEVGSLVVASSGVPYTVYMGYDVNGDGTNNDRPVGYRRNSERGAARAQLDVRIAKWFPAGLARIALIGEAFNVTNRANWTQYDGQFLSPTFGQPTGGGIARQLQLGMRLTF